MTKTFKELRDLDLLIGDLYAKDPSINDTKFGYAYKRFVKKNVQPVYEKYQEALADVRIANALEDPITHEILVDKESYRGYKFSREGLQKVIKEERSITEDWDKREIEVDPFLSPYVPESLTEEMKDQLTGLVILGKE